MIKVTIPKTFDANILTQNERERFDILKHCNGDLLPIEAKELSELIAIGEKRAAEVNE